MNKIINYIYFLFVSLLIILLIYVGATFTNFEYISSGDISTTRLTPTSVDSSTPHFEDLRFTLPSVLTQDSAVGFLTKHQCVEIKIDGQLIYSYTQGNNAFGKTPGIQWHSVRINKAAQGKEMSIYLYSPYSFVRYVPAVELGSKLSIFQDLLIRNIFSFTICIVMVLIGIVLIAYWNIMHKSLKNLEPRLLYLGIFSICYGLWAMNESPITLIILNNHVIQTYIAHLLLMLIPIPSVMFIRTLYSNRNSHFWDFLCLLSFLNITITTLLQVLNIADFRETLYLTHIILLAVTFSGALFTVVELKKHTMSRFLLINILCAILIFFGVILNLNSYFNAEYQHDTLIRVTFLLYVLLPAWYTIREISASLKKLDEADFYHKMAYYDQLTKVLNRNAYSEAIREITRKKEVYPMVVLCDLNNLKKSNDILGHNIGDQYIHAAADILRSTFSDYGKCYRIGGDEFCLLLKRKEQNTILSLLENINENWSDYNDLPDTVNPHIAYGYAVYDSILDHDFHDTIKRADALMYVNKKASKLIHQV